MILVCPVADAVAVEAPCYLLPVVHGVGSVPVSEGTFFLISAIGLVAMGAKPPLRGFHRCLVRTWRQGARLCIEHSS